MASEKRFKGMVAIGTACQRSQPQGFKEYASGEAADFIGVACIPLFNDSQRMLTSCMLGRHCQAWDFDIIFFWMAWQMHKQLGRRVVLGEKAWHQNMGEKARHQNRDQDNCC